MENVVLIVCILLILWLLMSHFEARRSLRWWYVRQSIQRCQEAELIRDGLLQEAFTLRRVLELSLINSTQSTKEFNQELLTTFERFHYDLKELSDRLSPAYVDDSLPLAIQHVLGVWQVNYPSMHIEADLPTDWHAEAQEHSHFVLTVLNELLQVVLLSSPIQKSIALCLKGQNHLSELTVHIKPLDQRSVFSSMEELNYLEQTFRVLMPGQCFVKQSKKTINCYFRWKS